MERPRSANPQDGMEASAVMKVAMMQPTFLPWQGFFELIYQSERFIFLDDFPSKAIISEIDFSLTRIKMIGIQCLFENQYPFKCL